MARDSCFVRVMSGVGIGGCIGGAVGAVYGSYEAFRYKVPGLLKIRHIGQTTVGSAAIFADPSALDAHFATPIALGVVIAIDEL
ncbi:hypothetical protein H6P81_013521 [Aristolochia fimbriata]|uniref:Reactive oxygen species modulator 1 n=1 Tax=Aristolochia fimbriata TaxID=158543 RepID=A0AAV7EJK4_ARIFI|nr:hypothetical protein H6P81_013521 [Aristolochia fimbriata]